MNCLFYQNKFRIFRYNSKAKVMKNIHVLPTDKPSRLAKLKIFGEYRYNLSKGPLIIQDEEQYVSIYITSDEEIKKGDWFLTPTNDLRCADIEWLITISKFIPKTNFKKITLTTDQDLIKDGVQAIDDEFLEWFVKNPSCEFVEVNYRYDTNLQPILDSFGNKVLRVKIPTESSNLSQIIIPKEEPKQETLEEAAEKYSSTITDAWGINEACKESFIDGAKWQQEQDKNKYSEKEVEEIFKQAQLCAVKADGVYFKYETFEKLKNK